MFDVMKVILISEKCFTETNYKKIKKALVYKKRLKLSDLLKFKLYIKECHQIV